MHNAKQLTTMHEILSMTMGTFDCCMPTVKRILSIKYLTQDLYVLFAFNEILMVCLDVRENVWI
jgi:hypothetical protein